MGASAGYHHSAGAIVGDTASGAAAGAAIGNVPGAIIGGAAGFLTGLLTGDQPDALPPPQAPPPPPDLADALAQRAQLAQQARLMAGGSGVFLSGPGGDASAAPGSAAKAGGT